MLGVRAHRQPPGVWRALHPGLRHNAPPGGCHVCHKRPVVTPRLSWTHSDDRTIPHQVDGGFTVRKYDSAIISVGQTCPWRPDRIFPAQGVTPGPRRSIVELTMATAVAAPPQGLAPT